MPADIPIGLAHLNNLHKASAMTQRVTRLRSGKQNDDLRMIGTSLSVFYQAATCHRKCHGGPHILESLTGRVYNLTSAAYNLIIVGFYDESFILIRSISEIYNLMALSVVDKNALHDWLCAYKKTRIAKYSPVKVRHLLDKSGEWPVFVERDWYDEICEKYTHVTPSTRPNMHNEVDRATVGGVFQQQEFEKTLGELATVAGTTAMIICQYFKFDDLFAEIDSHLREIANGNARET